MVDGLLDAVMETMQSALTFSQQHLLEGESAVDAETWYPDELPTDERDRLLIGLVTDRGLNEYELEVHLGAEPIPADRRTHTVMAGLLRKTFPSCYVVGEEATEEEWIAAEQAPIGGLIFSLDAIDGSLPYDTLTFGYSTNVLAFVRTMTRDELHLAAVANSSGLIAAYEHPGSVLVGTFSRHRSLTLPVSEDFRDGTVALLASDPTHRATARPLFNDPELTIFTTGGAPASLGLVMGRLAALVATKSQTTHDAAYLPILAFLGVPIVVEGNIALSLPDVLSFFSQVARNQDDRRAHPVPRFVAARSPQFAFKLASQFF